MNEFDKNFHLNFSPLYATFVIMLLMLWASEVKGDEIEEIVVTAQQEKTVKADPLIDNRLIEAIMPMFTYNAGGYGGFIGYSERGAQTNHTAVFVNGIPANDPGAGWYDFGHDFANGQTVKVITGANGVIYGSGSIAGTILIQDTIERGMNIRLDGEPKQYRIAPLEQLEFSMVEDNFASARNDNEEIDTYSNKTARINVDFGDFNIVGKYSDYEYDYDNCYDYYWGQSNDCLQDGERYNIAIRNDFMTIGRNYNTADYFTVEDPTYTNESYRDFIRLGNHMELSKNLSVAFGLDAEKIYYNTNSWNNTEGSLEVKTEITEPGISYEDDDTNKSRPLWTGGYIGTGEFLTSYVGDGNFEIVQTENKYTDDNAGIYFSANANFILNYNFGVRLGNDKQNALRLGISKGEWFFNAGNSFRKPNLYELFGDSYVEGNLELEPEEGVGFELGYGAISIFMYDFKEAIEYVPGYNTAIDTTSLELDAEATLYVDTENPENNGPGIGCVLNPNWTENDAATFELDGCIYKTVTNTENIWTMASYQNTGSYTTQGIRYENNFGPVGLMLNYTDTDQTRIPEFAGVLSLQHNLYGYNLKLNYAVQLDREPGPYDFLTDGKKYLDDLEKLDFNVSRKFTNGVSLAFKIENVTDEIVEVTPFYDSRGREVYLTLGYKW